MKRAALALLFAPALAQAQDGALSGPTGLLAVPTARVAEEGTVRTGVSWHDAVPANDGVVNYLFNIGFLPGLELGGRAADFGPGLTNDLSLNAKYAYAFDNGFALAVGAQDIGGEARNFRSRYAVATLPWHTLSFTAGHGWGPDLLDGTLAGLEWRPWPWAAVYAEYDADEVNSGLKLSSPALWAGLRIGANAGYREATNEVEGAIQLTVPLGRGGSGSARVRLARGEGQGEGQSHPSPLPASSAPPLPAPRGEVEEYATLRAALEALGFEAVRTGTRGDDVWVVALENRRYNHSAADGVGLALGTIARHAPPAVRRVELALSAYGVPQLVVATSPHAYREFLRTGIAPQDLLEVRYGSLGGDDVQWHNRAGLLRAGEVVVEPVLRTFVATEYGMLDAGLGARARFTGQLDRGVIAHLGVQAPLALTDDFHDGRNFEGAAPEAGLDLLMLQYAHAPAPGWTSLWSVGIMQVFQVDLRTFGVEQLWASPEGRHRLNAKLMLLNAAESHEVALGGYTWFLPEHGVSIGLTGGRFYAGDSGVRVDLNRHFDDTIAGLFVKAEAHDSLAAGFQISLPLTPRRDAAPRGLQVKGARRWGHSLQTTLNLPDGTNALRPLMLYEPVTDLDLRRDFLDSNRLGPAWLRGQLPRLREAWLLWGAGGAIPGG